MPEMVCRFDSCPGHERPTKRNWPVFFENGARVVKLVYTPDLKSCGQKCPYGFDSRPEHIKTALWVSARRFFYFGGTKSGTNLATIGEYLVFSLNLM